MERFALEAARRTRRSAQYHHESGSAGALHARAGDGQGYARPQGVHRRRWRASQRHRHLLQSVVATRSTYGAGRDLGGADRAVRVGAATQARCSDQVGDAQRRPDGRPQRHGRHQGVEEPRPGSPTDGFLAVDQSAGGSCERFGRQPREQGRRGFA